MSYVGVQRQTDSTQFATADYTIAPGANVNFNTNLDYFAGTDATVTYDPDTFEFTFTKAGYYYVDWFIVLQSAFSTSGPTFTLVAKTGTTTDLYQSTSSFKTGTLSGSAIVSAQVGTTLKLRNDTGAVAIFANNILDTNGAGIVANITIAKYVQDVTGLEVGLSSATNVANGAVVAYNTPISTIAGSPITNTAGVFTVNATGIYLFDWIVSVAGINGVANELKFELREGGTTVVGSSVSPVVNQGFITGTAIVSATAGQTFSLYNNTVDTATAAAGITIYYDKISIQAYMRVFTLV